MDSGIGSSHHQQQQNRVLPQGDDHLYRELWKACAGPLMDLPRTGERVYYLPRTHINLLIADEVVPSFDLPSHILCRVINIQLLGDADTDEVYAQITLIPEQDQSDLTTPDAGCPEPLDLHLHSFSKVLTASDTNSNWGLTVRRDDAKKCFLPLDITKQKPIQELIVKDLYGCEWRFSHVFQGQPPRHLLTKGWRKFVATKRLVVGDSVIFLRGGNGELRIGVRRHAHQRHNIGSSPVSSQTVQGVLAVASHAFTSGTLFTVRYQPRISGCILSLSKYLERNRENSPNQTSAQIASNSLSIGQVSVDVDDLDCDLFNDILFAQNSHFVGSTLEPNGNGSRVASTVPNFEGLPEFQMESFPTYSQLPILEPSSTLVQPTDTLQMLCTYSSPSQLPTEGPGCGSELVPWAGYQVAQRCVPTLNRVIMRYPSTISGFKVITGALQSVYLEMLAKLVNLLELSTIGHMENGDQFQVIKQYLADLKFIGINISWIESRLEQVHEVFKREKLIQQQHTLTHRIEETEFTLGQLQAQLCSVRKSLEESTPKVGLSLPSKNCPVLEGLL